MSTPFAFDREPYLTELDAVALSLGTDERGLYVVLDDTILYAEGGGQPADRGLIGGSAVLDVQKCEGEIRHYLAAPLNPGPVRILLDWARRFDHMQQHTGQHLLTAVAQEHFGWATTAFHLGETRCDVELTATALTPEDLDQLEADLAAEIRAARIVRAQWVKPEDYAALSVRSRGLPEGHQGAIRLVAIDGLDLNTCGGTHVGSTAELEVVKLLGTEPIRGGTRLFFVAGGRARQRLTDHERRNARLRALLGAPDEDLVACVEGKIEQIKESERRARILEEALAASISGALALSPDRMVNHHFEDQDTGFIQKAVRQLVALAPQKVVFFTASRDGVNSFVLAAGEASGFDVAVAGKELTTILEAKGGGAKGFFQGKAASLAKRNQALAWLSA